MISKSKIISSLILALVLMTSCGTVKDIAYFQNKVVNEPEAIDKHAGIVIQPKDMLSIVVSPRRARRTVLPPRVFRTITQRLWKERTA